MKKNKKQYYQNKKQHFQGKSGQNSTDIDNLKGFIITCDQNREKNALKDAYNFLNEYVDSIYQDIKQKQQVQQKNSDVEQIVDDRQNIDDREDDKKDGEVNLEKELQQELKQLKKKDEKIFYQFQTGITKGVIFVKINQKYEQIDPKEISENVLKDIHENKKQLTRYCHRMIPIQICCKNEIGQIKQKMEKLVNENIENDRQVDWMCLFKSRFQEKVKKQEVFDMCHELMKEQRVEYNDPEYTLYIEINKNVAYMSVLRYFQQYRKYSLHAKSELVVDVPQKKVKKEGTDRPDDQGHNQQEEFKVSENEEEVDLI